ncbi:uncharacterized protein N7446_007592, partial [Penicillium canescens]|uniref:uncharacterized protein n=1 Tax=Penicillium canescens TaxID=5083 RepID=UPI0026E0337A
GFAPCDEPKVLLNKTSKPTKIFILHQYGNSMKSSSTTNRQLTCFRELIFCSLCAVALTAVESKDDVYETMRGFLDPMPIQNVSRRLFVVQNGLTKSYLFYLTPGGLYEAGTFSLLAFTGWFENTNT